MNKETRLILENQLVTLHFLRMQLLDNQYAKAPNIYQDYLDEIKKQIKDTEEALNPPTNDLAKQRAEAIKVEEECLDCKKNKKATDWIMQGCTCEKGSQSEVKG
jgi:hypothetical protein